MELLLVVAGVLAMALFLLIDHVDAVLDTFLPSEDPLEQFDPAEESTDRFDQLEESPDGDDAVEQFEET
jgi:hypothetical protein